MKRAALILAIMVSVLFFNQHQSEAVVVANGWMNWNLPTGTRFGDDVGIVSAREYQRNGIINTIDLFEYDNVSPFSISLTDGYSNVSTDINSSTHKISGQVSALSMNQSDINYRGIAGSAGGQYIYYTGILSNFDYSYFFHGQNDSLRDILTFTIQVKASYYDAAGALIDAYTDYQVKPYVIPNAYSITNNTNAVEYSGTFHRDLSSLGSQNWFIAYDFYVGGNDTVDSNSNGIVPEPTSLSLLGLGLSGLLFKKRKRIV